MALKISYLIGAILFVFLAIRFYYPQDSSTAPESSSSQRNVEEEIQVSKRPNIVFILADDLVKGKINQNYSNSE